MKTRGVKKPVKKKREKILVKKIKKKTKRKIDLTTKLGKFQNFALLTIRGFLTPSSQLTLFYNDKKPKTTRNKTTNR